MDRRFKQAEKEAKLAFCLTLLYFIMWTATAYSLSSKKGLLGFPVWFEASCILLPLTFILLCWLVVSHLFQNMPLTPSDRS